MHRASLEATHARLCRCLITGHRNSCVFFSSKQFACGCRCERKKSWEFDVRRKCPRAGNRNHSAQSETSPTPSQQRSSSRVDCKVCARLTIANGRTIHDGSPQRCSKLTAGPIEAKSADTLADHKARWLISPDNYYMRDKHREAM